MNTMCAVISCLCSWANLNPLHLTVFSCIVLCFLPRWRLLWHVQCDVRRHQQRWGVFRTNSLCLLLPSVWPRLNSSVLFPNRRLQPVVQPHHGPPGAQDAHVQAAGQKPLQQRQRRRPSGAFAFPCASSSSSAHAFHPAAEGARQRTRQRLCWRVRTALTRLKWPQCDCCWKTPDFQPIITFLPVQTCSVFILYDRHCMSTICNNFLCLWTVDGLSFVSLFHILVAM